MPHKHKRRKQDNSESLYDLPPTQRAKALPVKQAANKPTSDRDRKKQDFKRFFSGDDTPRAFQRLLEFQKTGKGVRRILDNGVQSGQGKKRKRGANEESSVHTNEMVADGTLEVPRIQPGERLGDFAARVDQSMPIAGLATKGKKVEGMKERRTKHERKLRKLQDQWRVDEARIREKEEEEKEQADEEWEEKLAGMDKEARDLLLTINANGRKSKKGKKSKLIGEVDDDEGDPWAVLKTRREKPKGVFDVADAPPQFRRAPKTLLKSGDGVPKSAGSLRRREQLNDTRSEIIVRYREMMAAKRQV